MKVISLPNRSIVCVRKFPGAESFPILLADLPQNHQQVWAESKDSFKFLSWGLLLICLRREEGSRPKASKADQDSLPMEGGSWWQRVVISPRISLLIILRTSTLE